VHGKMFLCIASHESAEPNSLVVMMAFADRDALVEDDPATGARLSHHAIAADRSWTLGSPRR
jgi:hypothetical protein